MKRFVLFWFDGTHTVIEKARNIVDAFIKAGPGIHRKETLVAYEIDGRRIEVTAQAGCGCVYHAEEGRPCEHDLALIGL